MEQVRLGCVHVQRCGLLGVSESEPPLRLGLVAGAPVAPECNVAPVHANRVGVAPDGSIVLLRLVLVIALLFVARSDSAHSGGQ